MKTLGIMALLMSAAATLNAQYLKISEVPSQIQSTFNQSHPKPTNLEWEKEMGNYKAEFDINNLEHEVWYDSKGNVVKSEMEIDATNLPSVVSTAIKAKYADYKIDTAEVNEEGNKKTYEIEIEKGSTEERKLVFDIDGNIILDTED